MDRRAWRLADFGWSKPPRIAPALLPALAGLILAAPILAVSLSPAAAGGPPIPPGWTAAERWAWQQIAAERVADFNQRYGEALDPAKPDGWDNAKKRRRLSAAFLKTILTQKPFKEATPDAGVAIRGGWFPEPIELTGSVLGGLIWLGESRFEELIDLVAARLAGSLALVDSVIVHELDLSSATLEGSVFLNGAIIDGVAARLVKLGGQLNLSGGRYEFVDLEAGNIKDSIIIKDAEISEALHVRGGVVGGQVMIAGSKIGELNLNGIIIKRGFFLHHSYLAKDANLRGMQPGTGTDIAGSLLEAVDMDSVRVDGGAYFAESEFNGPLSLRGAKIGGQLALIEGRFA